MTNEEAEVETRVLSASKEVIIGGGRPTVFIGERINPTGKKRLAEALAPVTSRSPVRKPWPRWPPEPTSST